MPSDMPPQQIIEALQDLGIEVNDCRVMTNRRTGLPMPLFLLSLPRNEANRDVYNITEICFMKIIVEPLKPRNGPAQSFRCQGFFHSSRFCTRNPKCVKCGKPHLTRDCEYSSDPNNNHQLHPSANQASNPTNRDKDVTPAANASTPAPIAQPPQDSSLHGTLKELQDPQPYKTFLQPCITFNIHNYSTYRTDRLTHRGGGTAILVKNSIAHNSIKIHTDAVETTAIEIKGPTSNITICSIYKPPPASTPNFIQDLTKIFRNRTQCLVVGDFNAKHRSWNNSNRNSGPGMALYNFARSKGLVISAPSDPIFIPTQRNRVPGILDLGLSRGLSTISTETRCELSSDHNPVHFVVNFNFNSSHILNCKTITNWNKYQDILSTTIAGNPPISNIEDIEKAIENFNLNIHTAINQSSKFLPTKQAFTLVPLPVRLKIREKNRLRKLWQETRYPPMKAEMNRLTREIKKDIIFIKRREWDAALVESGSSPNNVHKFIARMNRKPVFYPPLLGSQGLVFGTREKADLFVDALEDSFQENRTPYDDDHIDEVDRVVKRFLRRNTPATPPLTSPNEICNIIKKLDRSDQVKNIALKSLPINAITHLTKIINRCLLLNHFPKPWKHATITMLPKPKKDLKFPINFRPISLISSIAKIYEKILLSRIEKHTADNGITPDFQHGFRGLRKETSTCHQLLRVANKIIHGFNHSKTTGGLFLDVEKAFDRLWHNGLIYKMILLNYPDYIIHTLADYLDGRTFQIKIDATISRTGQIQAGCPQGSNLSPILYHIYTHDFPTSPVVEICLFADDAAIISQADRPQDVQENLQKYLTKLKKWLKLWRISINTDGRSPVPRDCNCNFYICPVVVYKERNFLGASLTPPKRFWCEEESQRVQGAEMTQGPSESVQEFGARINKLGTQIFQSGNSAQNTAVRNENDQLLQSRFISGLRNDIRRFVLSRDPLNLDESINAALIEEQNMKLNQIASEERSGLWSAQTKNPVLSALADRLEEINLRVGRLQEASAVTARKSGGNYFNRRESVFKCFYCGIQGHRQAECRKRQRDERAVRYQPPRRNAASEYFSNHPGSEGRQVHFRESALRDPRHSVRGSHTNSGNRGFQRYHRNETLNSRGESRI
ncbi:probable RNA-directed DNA polymerase from transposon X-element [Trichonephila clavipes]|nr:probable RNA-directed DNA polymerase from transposon X-element [Trichonephila clavipes]